mgnify:CR=1 FL=1
MLLLSNTGIFPADSVAEILASLLRLTTSRKKRNKGATSNCWNNSWYFTTAGWLFIILTVGCVTIISYHDSCVPALKFCLWKVDDPFLIEDSVIYRALPFWTENQNQPMFVCVYWWFCFFCRPSLRQALCVFVWVECPPTPIHQKHTEILSQATAGLQVHYYLPVFHWMHDNTYILVTYWGFNALYQFLPRTDFQLCSFWGEWPKIDPLFSSFAWNLVKGITKL